MTARPRNMLKVIKIRCIITLTSFSLVWAGANNKSMECPGFIAKDMHMKSNFL